MRKEMEFKMKCMYEILVPTSMKRDGVLKPIRTRYHRVWDSKVREISGGLTILTPAKGQWVSPKGEIFIEKMIPVRIVCTEDEMEKIADMSAKYYLQEAILYYRVSDHVAIRHYDEKFKFKKEE